MPDIRIMLVDNRPFVLTGLHSMLAGQPGIDVVGVAAELDQARQRAQELAPTLILMSSPSGCDGMAEATATLLGTLSPRPRILVLTNTFDDDAHDAIRAGAAGILLEQSSERALLSAVRSVAAGHLLFAPTTPVAPVSGASTPSHATAGQIPNRLELLTQREFDVFELVVCGRRNADISKTLSLSENTVKSHVRSLLVKLGLRNRVEATIYAHELALMRFMPANDS